MLTCNVNMVLTSAVAVAVKHINISLTTVREFITWLLKAAVTDFRSQNRHRTCAAVNSALTCYLVYLHIQHLHNNIIIYLSNIIPIFTPPLPLGLVSSCSWEDDPLWQPLTDILLQSQVIIIRGDVTIKDLFYIPHTEVISSPVIIKY